MKKLAPFPYKTNKQTDRQTDGQTDKRNKAEQNKNESAVKNNGNQQAAATRKENGKQTCKSVVVNVRAEVATQPPLRVNVGDELSGRDYQTCR